MMNSSLIDDGEISISLITVAQLFRKPEGFFSIERIFKQLNPEFTKELKVINWKAPVARFSFSGVLKNVLSARKAGANIYHITGHLHYLVLGLPREKTLLTIHDCVFLYRWKGWKRTILKWFFLDFPVKNSKLITTISETTKEDIIKYTGCHPSKIIVVPNPYDQGIIYQQRAFNKEKPVLLFVGSTPHKNLVRLIPALENIPCHLEIVGRIGSAAEFLLKKYGISYSQSSGLTDQEMSDKYIASDIIVFPSTFEGFGLPVIEGQKAGRAVLTSNLSPMKEVAGDAACLIDPYDIQSIREGILKIIREDDYRNSLITKGFQNITRFSPNSIAQQYLACYKKLLSS
jgi:glycosyltransferase involved in cell wall biosynthesis